MQTHTRSTQANVFVPQTTPSNALQLRNFSVSPWDGLPSTPTPSQAPDPTPSKAPAPAPRTPTVTTPAAAPTPAPVVAPTPTRAAAPAPAKAPTAPPVVAPKPPPLARAEEQPLVLNCSEVQGYIPAPLTDELTEITALQAYTNIIDRGQYPPVPPFCNPNNVTDGRLRQACYRVCCDVVCGTMSSPSSSFSC